MITNERNFSTKLTILIFNHCMFNNSIATRKLKLSLTKILSPYCSKPKTRSSRLWCWDLSTKWHKVTYPRTSKEHMIYSHYSQHRAQYLGGRELYHCLEATTLHGEDRSFHTPPRNWNDCHCHHSLHTQILGTHQVMDYSTISGNILGKGQSHMGHCTHL